MPNGTFLYFAYGSNMLTQRLRGRCPSANPSGLASARGYRLSFSKRSDDGSGKATLVNGPEHAHEVMGVLFEIAEPERSALDRAEGKGYRSDNAFSITRLSDGAEGTATTHLAPLESRDESLIPYDWYHALVLAGAIQHGVPNDYVAELRNVTTQPDRQANRPSRQAALQILRATGFQRLMEELW